MLRGRCGATGSGRTRNALPQDRTRTMAAAPHDRIIARAAREAPGPLGVVRRGRSRLWIDDRGWFATLVEFQPVRGWRGTSLIVAVSLLWSERAHWTFDLPLHRAPLVHDEAGVGFAAAVGAMAGQARETVEAARVRLGGPRDVAQISEKARADDWKEYHPGIAAALAGRPEEASARLGAIRDPGASIE